MDRLRMNGVTYRAILPCDSMSVSWRWDGWRMRAWVGGDEVEAEVVVE